MHKIAYSLFSHKALFTFAKEVLAIIAAAGIDLIMLTNFVDKLSNRFNDFDSALKRDYVDPYTIKINDADRERDLRLIGFKNYVDACGYRKDESWQKASEQILSVIERYGSDMYRYSLPEESAAPQNLMTDLKKEPLQSACTTIDAAPWLDEMTESQTHFETMVQQRHSQPDVNDKTLVETRKPLIKALKNLLKMVELQQAVEATDAINALVNQLNNLIDSSMASARISRSLSDKANAEN
ncbi:DUF6261 family protein [Carboxylicivirga marina]|uniref:DUF6261 family protein n=1 Tax=Carboxylicivirga marina TaxID=2800988 RepID=UPI0025936730|nr:DUF6261 family protein [uncultured Carboxylicivirga sp.]